MAHGSNGSNGWMSWMALWWGEMRQPRGSGQLYDYDKLRATNATSLYDRWCYSRIRTYTTSTTHTYTNRQTFARVVHLAGRMMRHRHTHTHTIALEDIRIRQYSDTKWHAYSRIRPIEWDHIYANEREKASIFMKLLPAAIVENFLVRETWITSHFDWVWPSHDLRLVTDLKKLSAENSIHFVDKLKTEVFAGCI